MTVCERLRQVRESKKVSRGQLEIKSKVPQRTIRSYEVYGHAPSFINILKLTKALGISLDEFAEGITE